MAFFEGVVKLGGRLLYRVRAGRGENVGILEKIGDSRVSAIIRTGDADLARKAMRAAVSGGFRLVEFTLTTPDALSLIREFSSEPDLLVGAGTVLEPEQARAAVEAGARFLVSPVFDARIVEEAKRLKVVSIPGTYTPNEMVAADRAGADILKVFPSPPNVPEFITAVLGPLPHLRLFPTAGVDEDNFVKVLEAGAFGVGFVRSLFDPRDMLAGDFDAIEARAARIMARLRDCQGASA